MARLLSAARNGERCPTQSQLTVAIIESNYCGDAREIVQEMAREGLFRIEVYGRNWRVVDIPGVGRTKEPPHGGQPYRVIEKAA